MESPVVKVYIFAGFMTVLAITGLAWLIIARFGLAIFRTKKKEKNDQATPVTDPRRNRGGDGPGFWV